jgi:L-lactate dehydrogenase complex protein LldG
VSKEARDAVLGRVRQSLGRGRDVAALRRTIAQRLSEPRANLIPARANLDRYGRIAVFTAQAEAVQATVRRVDRYRDLPRAVVDYLRLHNLPPRLIMASDPVLAQADWQSTMLEIGTGPAAEEDPVGLTTAYAGIAETGTLMLLSGPQTPTTLAFLPETSLIALSTERILRAYADGFALLRAEQGDLPRSINFITGPSRSGDIEQTIQLGAHGPRRLCVLLVDEPAGPLRAVP